MARPLKATPTFPTPGPHPCGLAWDGIRLWDSDGKEGRITALKPDGGIERSIDCPEVRTGLAYAEGLLWQVCGTPKELRAYTMDGHRRSRLPRDPPGDWACGIDIRDGVLWVAVKKRSVVESRELRTGRVLSTLPGCADPGDLTLVGGDLWLADYRRGMLLRIDMGTGDRIEYLVGGSPTGLGSDGTHLWCSDFRRPEVRQFSVPKSR